MSTNADPIIASTNLQNHLSLMEDWYTKWRFKINQSKPVHTTNILLLTLKLAQCPDVSLYGIQIPSNSTAKYLGLILNRRLTYAHHIKAKRLQLNSHLRSLKTLMENNKHTKLNIKLLIYKSLFKPI